uniref:Uncharacterized protein n=1 Tax=Steinernema glaseri TaxID=37863 RepID=A0A1I7YAN7_9BILA
MDPYAALLKCSQIASGQDVDDGGETRLQDFREALTNLVVENDFTPPEDHRFAMDRTNAPILATCRDVEQFMFQRLPQEILEALNSRVNPDWSLWRQHMEMRDKFRKAVMQFIKRPILLRGTDTVDDPFLFYVTKNTRKMSELFRKRPKRTNRYGTMFQAAAKRLIVERKLANPNADPWDVFFYKSVRIDADDATFKIDIDKGKMDAFLFEEPGEEPPSPIPDYETDIASLATNRFDLMALTPPPTKRLNSPPPEKQKKVLSLPASLKQPVLLPRRRTTHEPRERHSPKGWKAVHTEVRRSPNRLELPRVQEVPRSRSQGTNVRWKVTRVRHSPDGKTNLNRLFYLPDVHQKPSLKFPLPLKDILPSWGYYDSQF